jgi:hypothetical protein
MSVQGQGATTEQKERGIKGTLAISLDIADKPHLCRFPFWHIDLHSGSGFNKQAQCFGSPIAFLEAVRENPRPFRAFFVDINGACVVDLERRLVAGYPAEAQFCHSFIGDNQGLLPVVGNLIRQSENPRYAVGSLLSDPNGWTDDVPLKELANFAAEFPRIDLIFNLNVRWYRLAQGQIAKGLEGWVNKDIPSISDFPGRFSRKYWLLRKVIQSKGAPFVMLVGRNIQAGDWKAFGFHHLESDFARAEIERIERRASERADIVQALPELPGLFETSSLSSCSRGGNEQGRLDV